MRNRRGQGAAEYTITLALVGLFAIGALQNMSTSVVNGYDKVTADVQSATPPEPPPEGRPR
jgi:Flp pilus assembly pilin Flp